jgi:hypothetical protein
LTKGRGKKTSSEKNEDNYFCLSFFSLFYPTATTVTATAATVTTKTTTATTTMTKKKIGNFTSLKS